MEEVNEEEDFVVEGPLWIQVHAFEKGVEVTISKSKNEDLMNVSDDEANEQLDYQVSDILSQTFDQDDSLEELLEQKAQQSTSNQQEQKEHKQLPKNSFIKFTLFYSKFT